MNMLTGIGLTRNDIKVDVIRSVDETHWRRELDEMKAQVFPYLRWVGIQRASAAAKK